MSRPFRELDILELGVTPRISSATRRQHLRPICAAKAGKACVVEVELLGTPRIVEYAGALAHECDVAVFAVGMDSGIAVGQKDCSIGVKLVTELAFQDLSRFCRGTTREQRHESYRCQK
jgi:hypothetical protein